MAPHYSDRQHKEYVTLIRRAVTEWLVVFDNREELYSIDYWDLLSSIWYADRPVTLSEAVKFMRYIKSPYTARKYVQHLVDEGFLIEMRNPKDDRSVLVMLSPDAKQRLDRFFDKTTDFILDSAESIQDVRGYPTATANASA